jgi:SAM-dependent methyltransferase
MLSWASTHAEMVVALLQLDRILEVGTGTGMLSALLSRAAPLVVSLDQSEEILRTADDFQRTVRGQVRQVRGDAFRLPFKDQTFDAAFSQGLLEHFDDEGVRTIVLEQRRVAATVFASIPSAFYPRIGRRGPGLIGNERLLSARRWRDVLADFEVSSHYYADYKLATFAGVTLPWPNQLLLVIR